MEFTSSGSEFEHYRAFEALPDPRISWRMLQRLHSLPRDLADDQLPEGGIPVRKASRIMATDVRTATHGHSPETLS